jgi:23S rRNA pseudouridine2457 synthase
LVSVENVKARKMYFVIYKPFGMLSQFSREHPEHITLADLDFNFPKDVYPVGRLDKDSEGLLILTNDKRLTDKLLNPKHKHWRSYWVQVDNIPTPVALRQLATGVEIKINKKIHSTAPAKVELLVLAPTLPERTPSVRYRKEIPTAWLNLSLTEGKNRQVRRMTAKVGFPTLRLVRHQIGDLHLGDLASGAVLSYQKQELYTLLGL